MSDEESIGFMKIQIRHKRAGTKQDRTIIRPNPPTVKNAFTSIPFAGNFVLTIANQLPKIKNHPTWKRHLQKRTKAKLMQT
jgi:hypothetical protein